MKKYMWLMVLVLAMSTTAWGFCRIDVSVDPDPPVAGESWQVIVEGCIPGENCEVIDTDIEVRLRLVIVEVLVECDCCTGGCTELEPVAVDAPELQLCGVYFIVVKVYRQCRCDDQAENSNGDTRCFCPWKLWCRPILCGIGSTYFRIWDEDCCGPWWNCP